MELTTVKVEDLTPHPENYNTHPENQLVELERSLDDFSQFKNIVVCKGVILTGHGLVQAAKRKGIKELSALVKDDLTDDQQKKLLIADNATPFLAVPDLEGLDNLLKQLEGEEIAGVTDDWLENVGLGEDIDIFFDKNAQPSQGGACLDPAKTMTFWFYKHKITTNDEGVNKFMVENVEELRELDDTKLAQAIVEVLSNQLKELKK